MLPALRHPARAEPTAWTVVLALLCQLWLGVPLAVEMTAGHAGAHDHAAHCEGDESAPEPATTHSHAQCVICQTALTPSLTAPGALIALAAPETAADEAAAPAARTAPSAPLAYQSRAPPAAA
jgi:hypothetical protein